MYCVNCGQAVEGSIPSCAHCAGLVIAKEEEKARFLEFIRQEAQATISKDDASVAVKPDIEPEVGTEVESEVEPLAPASNEHNQDNQQSTEEATAEQTKHNNPFIDILIFTCGAIVFVFFIMGIIFALTS